METLDEYTGAFEMLDAEIHKKFIEEYSDLITACMRSTNDWNETWKEISPLFYSYAYDHMRIITVDMENDPTADRKEDYNRVFKK